MIDDQADVEEMARVNQALAPAEDDPEPDDGGCLACGQARCGCDARYEDSRDE